MPCPSGEIAIMGTAGAPEQSNGFDVNGPGNGRAGARLGRLAIGPQVANLPHICRYAGYLFVLATSLSKSNKCWGLKAFFDHRQESENSTPAKKPISR